LGFHLAMRNPEGIVLTRFPENERVALGTAGERFADAVCRATVT